MPDDRPGTCTNRRRPAQRPDVRSRIRCGRKPAPYSRAGKAGGHRPPHQAGDLRSSSRRGQKPARNMRPRQTRTLGRRQVFIPDVEPETCGRGSGGVRDATNLSASGPAAGEVTRPAPNRHC